MQQIRRLFSLRISNPTLAGLCYAFSWMMIGALILSLFLWLSGMQEKELTAYTYVVHACAVSIGGLVSGKRSGRKGWYQGGVTGTFYGVLILIIGFLALDNSLSLSQFYGIAAAFVIGSIGGMFGVNMRNHS
ncbi:putative membrane protein (TIGR04086 family) [Paenibacillus sp. DS2015]|uniref:TIGR04086 family membrane protein n=1 Tax=Paenibacillus sp. DS2015 TaxID=3373917 RepID=UPI003D252153